MAPDPRRRLTLADGAGWALCAGLALLVGQLLRLDLLMLPNWPAGGDTPSQAWHAWLWTQEAWGQGRLTTWMPEAFAGFPLMSYYFPLPFAAIAALSPLTGFVPAFKLVVALPALALPAVVYGSSRGWLRLGPLPAMAAALFSSGVLLHESNSLWGGNLLSLLAGEFAYAWGLAAAVAGWAAFVAAERGDSWRAWVLAAVLEAAVGLCHGYALLALGFATAALLLLSTRPWRTALGLAAAHAAAFLLLAGWLWPLLDMHALTVANDSAGLFAAGAVLWPLPWLAAAGLALGGWALMAALRRAGAAPCRPADPALLGATLAAAGIVATLALVAERIGLADIRFVPLAWLLSTLACGWGTGWALQHVPSRAQGALAVALVLAWLALMAQTVQQAPAWARWNAQGLEAKPAWSTLMTLAPALRGSWQHARLVFEHDPANDDLGSTRALETLPRVLGGRAVLEGLYMESALLAPAVYLLQSTVSAQPSSPLVRHPAGELNPGHAARLMRLLWVRQVLVRSDAARLALMRSPHFRLQSRAGPFAVFELVGFDVPLIDASPRTWQVVPAADRPWHADRWLRGPDEDRPWPVYRDDLAPGAAEPPACAADAPHRPQSPNVAGTPRPGDALGSAGISDVIWQREQLRFTTTRIGQPHLVRMAYHPRWQLQGPGRVDLVAPGLLRVTPCQAEVSLAYASTGWMRAGAWVSAGTAAALLAIAFVGWRRRPLHPATPPGPPILSRRRGLAVAATVSGLAWVAGLSAPGRAYEGGWQAWRSEHFDAAALSFARAAASRPSPAGRAEAHFWAAKAWERAGQWDRALPHYQAVVQDEASRWRAESLFNAAQVLRLRQQPSAAQALEARLRAEHPGSPWALRLGAGPTPPAADRRPP